MPLVQAGSIIEYRWRETRLDPFTDGVELDPQRDVPGREVTCFIKP